ncbi:MAG: hypothetical protein ACXVAR_02350 [Vulcanimicrobiaceae bacterium]
MRIKWRFFVAAIGLYSALFTVSVHAQTQSSPMPQSASATAQLTAKVIAIDYNNRILTLQDAQGNTRDVKVGPDVKRFNAIHVGDTITFTYKESVAVAIAKPGAPTPASESTPTITRTTGEKPGGTISQTQTTTVTIQSIDVAKPAITVKTQDGRVLTFLVQNKNNLEGLKPGDVVQVTYTQALVISVK